MIPRDETSPTFPWTIRSTTHSDRSTVGRLLSNAPNRHLHLDWYATYDLLDESPSLIAHEGEKVVGILACPMDPAGIGWIRYFAGREGTPVERLWELLWEEATKMAETVGIHTIAALVTQSWFIPLLQKSRFRQSSEVLFFEWRGGEPTVDLPIQATLRKMVREDLEAVARVDEQAFKPLWQHSLRALQAAFDISAFATVLEVQAQVVAYQISTASALGAHLARLAVDPAHQGAGLAKALVTHAIRHFLKRGIDRMSVNTQLENQRSQILYERLGFTPTGQRFPVYTFNF